MTRWSVASWPSTTNAPYAEGRPYWHYRNDFATVKGAHITYVEQTDFIGAFLGTELIGYIKLVHGRGKSSIMQILSKIAHRDKAPNNALIAKAVEICTANNVPHLHYATWSRRGLGDFKISHGFQRFEVPRYFVPLTAKGAFMLRFKLHHRLRDRLPEKWVDYFALVRAKWCDFRHKGDTARSASPKIIPSR